MTVRTWRDADIRELVAWLQGREVSATPLPRYELPGDVGASAEAVLFADGSALVIESNYDGPYSPHTPGVGAIEPTIWLGEIDR